jgi:predicted nucleotidyltransferase
MDELLQLAANHLIQQYKPHTLIAYGSRARNQATESSDIDLACYCDDVEEIKDAGLFQGVYLDAWIYPTSALETVSDESLRFEDEILLFDQRGLGEKYLQQVKEKLKQGPKKISQSDIEHTKQWIHKMLARSAVNDLDGQYRRIWLQFQLLEIYFQLRGKWFLGHKKSFLYLQENDLPGYELFVQVYADVTDYEKLRELTIYVVNI